VLTKPLNNFDLRLHSPPIVLPLIRLWRQFGAG
jgi:hypothetical protein